jgi:hypothetical protein
MFAEIRTVDGRECAVLTNRTDRPIVGVYVGCVVRRSDRWERISNLFGVFISDANIGSGAFFDVTRMFGGARNEWTDRPMGCDGSAPAVVGVRFEDGSEWQLPVAADEGGTSR